MVSLAEVWKAIPGFEGMYEASDQGSIRNTKSGLVLRSSAHRAGYRLIQLRRQGKYVRTSVHALVAAAFIGERPHKHDVNHIDGDKANNRPSNLEYVTRKGNMEHARRTGLWVNHGEANGQAKATESQVIEAHRLAKAGVSHKDICKATGLAHIGHILDGSKWKHLELEPVKVRKGGTVPEELRSRAREIVRSGGGYAELKVIGLSNGTASRLVKSTLQGT